jgi:hypothetical protein
MKINMLFRKALCLYLPNIIANYCVCEGLVRFLAAKFIVGRFIARLFYAGLIYHKVNSSQGRLIAGSVHRRVDSSHGRFIAGLNYRRVMSTENLIETWNVLAGHTKLGKFRCKKKFVAARRHWKASFTKIYLRWSNLRWIDPEMRWPYDELALRWIDPGINWPFGINRPCNESTRWWIDPAMNRPCYESTLE